MIVLDTNVLSELMRPRPAPWVVSWVDRQPAKRLFTTTVTRAEILYGLALLDPGPRRDRLTEAAREIFAVELAGRVLPFDSDASDSYAEIASARRRAGRPISAFDAQIAAIARSRGAALATRNLGDFEECGIELIDPWTTSPAERE